MRVCLHKLPQHNLDELNAEKKTEFMHEIIEQPISNF